VRARRLPGGGPNGNCYRVHRVVAVLWDPGKAASNATKHGVRFADAALVFDDPVAITVVDDESHPVEQRLVILGSDAAGRILVFVYSWRGGDIRLDCDICDYFRDRWSVAAA